jgi:hypothetical protein
MNQRTKPAPDRRMKRLAMAITRLAARCGKTSLTVIASPQNRKADYARVEILLHMPALAPIAGAPHHRKDVHVGTYDDTGFRSGLQRLFDAGYTAVFIISVDHRPREGKDNLAYLTLGPSGEEIFDARQEAADAWEEIRREKAAERISSAQGGQ